MIRSGSIITAVIIGLALLLAFWPFPTSSKIIPTESTSAAPTSTSSPLEKWLLRLAAGENCPQTGLIDTNGTSSYGRYCYQADTFLWLVRDLRMASGTNEEILSLIGSSTFQDRLTLKGYLVKPGIWTHWSNTVKKIGLPPLSYPQSDNDKM